MVKAELPNTLVTFPPFNQEIRYDAERTAVYVENLWGLLERCTYYVLERCPTYGLFCDDFESPGNGIRHLLLDANWFSHGCEDTPFSIHPWVNLFVKTFPDLEHITILFEPDAIQLDDEFILIPGYKVYSTTSNTVVDDIHQRALDGEISDTLAEMMLIDEYQTYCALTPEELYVEETKGKKTHTK